VIETTTTITLNYYNLKAVDFTTDTIDVSFTVLQETFLAYLKKTSKILDFGCGSGRDTKYFLTKGHSVDAIDGSKELCKIASEYTGIQVKQMLFNELTAIEEYDGIWACASILHMEKDKLPEVFTKMINALKADGIIYMSFKYGDFEGVKNGRYFTYLTEESFKDLLKNIPQISVEKIWITGDVRIERGEEQWLNILLRKQA
jgi:cyclopropane fatty-acyl-phospholipid synthase-like methyltransferase